MSVCVLDQAVWVRSYIEVCGVERRSASFSASVHPGGGPLTCRRALVCSWSVTGQSRSSLASHLSMLCACRASSSLPRNVRSSACSKPSLALHSAVVRSRRFNVPAWRRQSHQLLLSGLPSCCRVRIVSKGGRVAFPGRARSRSWLSASQAPPNATYPLLSVPT